MDTCRLCNTSRKFKDLSKIDNKQLEISKKLLETFNIQLASSSVSPQHCCRICIKKLNTSHSFYHQILENQKKFDALNFEIHSVIVKVEKLDEKTIAEAIKVEKEEYVDDSCDIDEFNDDSVDWKDDESYSQEVKLKQPATKIQNKKTRPKNKSKKSKCKKKPAEPKLEGLEGIYQNENKGTFTDNYLNLSIPASEMLSNGRLTLEVEPKYSDLKWTNFDWKCTETDCKESFENIVELDNHLKSAHQSKYKTFCNHCGITCSNFSSYLTHLIKYHNSNARFSCVICSTIFWNLNDLFRHYKLSHSERIIMCLYCGFYFNTYTVLKTHLMKNHKYKDSRDNFYCDNCDYVTKTKQTIAAHMINHMKSSCEICDQCGTIFKRRGALEMHKSYVHGNQDAIFSCHCGKTFKNLLALRKHRKIVHQKHLSEYNFECSFCGKKYRTNYQLKCHLYSHGQDTYRYECPHCDKVFKYTSGFKYHVRSAHTMEKPYGCPCCENTFFDYANASKHVKGCHGGDFKPIRVIK